MSQDPWAFQRWAFKARAGTPTRKAVLSMLAVMADSETGCCHAKQATLAEGVEVSERTVWAALRQLEADGLIARRHQHRADGSRRSDQFLLLAPWVTEWPDGVRPEPNRNICEKDQTATDGIAKPQPVATQERPSERPLGVNVSLSNGSSERLLTTPKSEAVTQREEIPTNGRMDETSRDNGPAEKALERQTVARVFRHWTAVTGRDPARTRLTSEREHRIVMRSRTFSADDLCRAISWAAAQPFYRGENDRNTRYDDLTTLLKNDTQVARFLEESERPPPAGPRTQWERNMDGLQQAWNEAAARENGELAK